MANFYDDDAWAEWKKYVDAPVTITTSTSYSATVHDPVPRVEAMMDDSWRTLVRTIVNPATIAYPRDEDPGLAETASIRDEYSDPYTRRLKFPTTPYKSTTPVPVHKWDDIYKESEYIKYDGLEDKTPAHSIAAPQNNISVDINTWSNYEIGKPTYGSSFYSAPQPLPSLSYGAMDNVFYCKACGGYLANPCQYHSVEPKEKHHFEHIEIDKLDEKPPKRIRYPAYKKNDRVQTPNGPGNVWSVDRDGTVCIELDKDPSILHEFEKKELKKIK